MNGVGARVSPFGTRACWTLKPAARVDRQSEYAAGSDRHPTIARMAGATLNKQKRLSYLSALATVQP